MTRSPRFALEALILLVLLMAGARPLRAQVGAGYLSGLVQDQGGAAVAGASITVTDLARNVSRVVVTSPEGAYAVGGLAPGVYRVTVERSGFRALARDQVHIETGAPVRLDLRLVVEGFEESVNVTADRPLLRSATASLGEVVSEEKIVGLPLNGRSFITLAALAPGVALPPGSQLPRINGGRPRTNEYLFDGISVLNPSPDRSRSSRWSTPSRSSRSRATAPLRSSGDSTAVS